MNLSILFELHGFMCVARKMCHVYSSFYHTSLGCLTAIGIGYRRYVLELVLGSIKCIFMGRTTYIIKLMSRPSNCKGKAAHKRDIAFPCCITIPMGAFSL